MVSKDIIRQRLRHKTKWVTTTATNIFEDVAESKIRYIVKIIITGDGVSTRTLSLYKVKENDTLEDLVPNITVAASAKIEIPEGAYGVESPIFTLEGGTNIAGKVDGNSLAVCVVYWDSEV